MSKSKNNRTKLSKEHKKIMEQYETENLSVKKVIIVIVTIILMFGVFYLLTIGILRKKPKTTFVSNASIQYSEILAGESFTQNEKEYLVLFYDSTKEDSEKNHTIIANYKSKKNGLTIYTVDMHEGLNKNYTSASEDNINAKEASELKISKTTLIHFKDNKIIEYITENIEQYLNSL
ncbi:MAG: hypothetical protein IKO49_02960 [Bacilli bacterium]|nr:hypothetical protein [Bacilli bacterium]